MSREKVLNDYLLLTSMRARQIFEKGLLEQEIINLREDIIAKFKSINEFETKYIFWHTHAGLMTYLSRQEEETLNKLQANIYEEREANGLIEPEPNNDAETEFVVKWHINNNLQSFKDYKILSFEEYKEEFEVNSIGKLNLLEFANEELEKINTYINSLPKPHTLIPANITSPIRYTRKISFSDFIYQMTNNNYQVDYSTLYSYIQGRYFDYHDLRLILTPIQYKRYLKIWINKYLSSENNIEKKTVNERFGLNLGYNNEQLKELYNNLIALNFLHSSTNLKHFINAFNGEPLAVDYKVLKWTKPTIGVICVSYLTKNNPRWKHSSSLFEQANYKQLLGQSIGGRIYDEIIARLKKIII